MFVEETSKLGRQSRSRRGERTTPFLGKERDLMIYYLFVNVPRGGGIRRKKSKPEAENTVGSATQHGHKTGEKGCLETGRNLFFPGEK